LRSIIRQFSILHFFRSPMNLLPSAVHVSSTIEFGAPRIHCLAMFANSPFSTFIQRPMNSLPRAFHVSSVIKRGASGDWEICFSVIFRIRSFAKHVYMCICILYSLFLLLFVFCFVLCRKKRRSRDETHHHGKGRTDEISVLSLLSSYLR